MALLANPSPLTVVIGYHLVQLLPSQVDFPTYTAFPNPTWLFRASKRRGVSKYWAPLDQDVEGKPKYVIRPYTPISDPESKGYFDLLIKVYPEGKMSQHFASLKPGNVVEMKWPIEKLKYTHNMKKHSGMIAGGTGITPMLQVIEVILKNPDDNTQISLLYANVSPADILLRQSLDVLAATHPNLKIFYTVDIPTKDWRGGAGYISKEMVVKGLTAPNDDSLILVCGPPGMMQRVSGEKAKDWTQGELTGIFKEVGYTEQMVYKFWERILASEAGTRPSCGICIIK